MLLHFCSMFLTGLSKKAIFRLRRSELWFFPLLRSPTWTLLTARTSDQFPTCHSSLRLLNVWSRSSSFSILKTLAFFRPTNLASEPTIPPKRLYCLFSLTSTLLFTSRSSHYWPCLMYLLLSTWSIIKSLLSVLRPRVESHLSLFFGSNLTSLTVLKRLSQVNPGLHGSLSCWVSPRVLCWVLFSSSYILLTFPLSFQSIRLLVISLLTTFRHMFMVFLLVNFFSPAKLNYFQMILTLGCPQIDSQLIWFGTPQQLLKLDHALLSDHFPHFTFHTTVRDLGVTLDSALTFSQHISNLTRSSHFQLRRLRTIRKAVSVPIFTSIVHAFVCSRIDYCNSLLIGLPKTRLSPLQTVLNAAARLIARLPRYSHISYYIKEHLHWLPNLYSN